MASAGEQQAAPPPPAASPDEPEEDSEEDPDDETPRKKGKKRDSTSLRKAPQAPKRFKSSYICFFMAKQPEIKESLGDKASVTEVSKRSAQMWRNLPSEERAHWDEVAAKDKQRYMMEKATYTGPWQVPWKRAKKDPSAPKRPMSAFLYFSQDKRRQIKEKNPDIRNTEISRILGEMWRGASEEEKKPHVERERQEREKYKVAIAEWREEFDKKMEDQRKKQASFINIMQQAENAKTADQAQYPPQPAGYGGHPPADFPPYIPPPAPAQYGYPPGYPMFSSYAQPPQARYGYANGKHVAVLGPDGIPHYPPAYTNPTQEQHEPQGLPGANVPINEEAAILPPPPNENQREGAGKQHDPSASS